MSIQKQDSSIWKKIEKFFGFVGFIAAIAAIIGFYYQFQNKKNEIQFVVLSKDYLTVKNNIEGLESNYKYAGQPVKNLWLIKFKIINSGDQTLVGMNKSSDLLDSVITFKFDKNVQLLNNVKIVKSNFPDHKLIKEGVNKLSLSFQQWRPNEEATYSIYLKSDIDKPKLLPKTPRSIKDGNIIIDDLSTGQRFTKQPIIDLVLNDSGALIGRILGIIFAVVLLITIIVVYLIGIFQWCKLRFWLLKNYETFKNFINAYDRKQLPNKSAYLKDPTSLYDYKVWNEWKNKGYIEMPETALTATTWKNFIIYNFIAIILNLCLISIILGLWKS